MAIEARSVLHCGGVYFGIDADVNWTEALLAASVIAFIAGHGLKKLALLAAILVLLIIAAPLAQASDMPPFKLDHPICPGGFTIAQRYDTRNSAGTIIKSVWVRKCTNGRVIYGKRI